MTMVTREWFEISELFGGKKKETLPLSQLYVSLFAGVLLGSARQLLGDDKLADVDAVAQKV